MAKLLAVSPVGKNGQTVVPSKIRRLFKLEEGRALVGFYLDGDRVELAPISIVREKLDYTEAELDHLERLGKARRGKSFKNGRKAKAHLRTL
ncbi:MAG: AbrB/MazE/SpoVT family DNA-binding domain-containing protein [Elusimicrobiota bacterium]